MMRSQPDQDPLREPSQPETLPPAREWSFLDLAAFGVFFALTLLLLPLGAMRIMRIFRPDLRFEDLTTVELLLLQGVMHLLLVTFIVFHVKIVHRRSFRATIHWFHNYQFGVGYLITLGAVLAISVLVASSFFPPSAPTPIEKLLTSARSLYVFAILGIAVAPLAEEIIFRGFVFKVLSDLRGPALAVPATAGLFALLHAPQLGGNWPAVVLILVVGYVLSLVRQKSDSLIPCFIIHTTYNASLFGIYALGSLVQRGVQP